MAEKTSESYAYAKVQLLTTHLHVIKGLTPELIYDTPVITEFYLEHIEEYSTYRTTEHDIELSESVRVCRLYGFLHGFRHAVTL